MQTNKQEKLTDKDRLFSRIRNEAQVSLLVLVLPLLVIL